MWHLYLKNVEKTIRQYIYTSNLQELTIQQYKNKKF